MKKLTIIISVLLLAVVFVSCTTTSVSFKGTRVGCVRTEGKYNFSLSCESFDGEAVYTINLDEEHGKIVGWNVTVWEGTLKIECRDSKDNLVATRSYYIPEYYSNEPGVMFYDQASFEEYGKCKIKIVAEGFKGDYSFNWDKEEVINYD